jgi:hypothetical protein
MYGFLTVVEEQWAEENKLTSDKIKNRRNYKIGRE